jgi:hypothetical protein
VRFFPGCCLCGSVCLSACPGGVPTGLYATLYLHGFSHPKVTPWDGVPLPLTWTTEGAARWQSQSVVDARTSLRVQVECNRSGQSFYGAQCLILSETSPGIYNSFPSYSFAPAGETTLFIPRAPSSWQCASTLAVWTNLHVYEQFTTGGPRTDLGSGIELVLTV